MTDRYDNPIVLALLQHLQPRGVGPRALASVLAEGSPRSLSAGERICVQDAQAEGIYFLVSGAVVVSRRDSGGHDRELTRIQAPAVLGHMAVIDRSPRSATVTAAGPVDLIALDSSRCEHIMGRADATGMALRRMLLTSLVRQLLQGNARIRQLARSPSDDVARPTASRGARARDVAALTATLDGWQALEQDIEGVGVVYTEDQLRNWPSTTPRR